MPPPPRRISSLKAGMITALLRRAKRHMTLTIPRQGERCARIRDAEEAAERHRRSEIEADLLRSRSPKIAAHDDSDDKVRWPRDDGHERI